jgi:hypothetical protein
MKSSDGDEILEIQEAVKQANGLKFFFGIVGPLFSFWSDGFGCGKILTKKKKTRGDSRWERECKLWKERVNGE